MTTEEGLMTLQVDYTANILASYPGHSFGLGMRLKIP